MAVSRNVMRALFAKYLCFFQTELTYLL